MQPRIKIQKSQRGMQAVCLAAVGGHEALERRLERVGHGLQGAGVAQRGRVPLQVDANVRQPQAGDRAAGLEQAVRPDVDRDGDGGLNGRWRGARRARRDPTLP